jgi:hypothetical protein
VAALLALGCLGCPPAEDPRGGSAGHSSSLPAHEARDPGAAVVTEENLAASERFWPYQVALTGRRGETGRIPAGVTGVLIRVEAGGLARVDFGRDGLLEVPIGETDLLERANRIRLGEAEKLAPNLVLAIGPRLLDSAAASPAPFDVQRVSEHRFVLCVFADPAADGFEDLARSLAPLREHGELLTVLFAQGEHADAWVRDRLRERSWTVPFVYDHLAEAYTASLLGARATLPAVLLLTAEGSVLLERPFTPEVAPELRETLEPLSEPPQLSRKR